MSQVSPGWYPDPSGRFAQRYHDGTRWTEHVADANGNRATDAPEGAAGRASYATSTPAHDQSGFEQSSGEGWGQQSYGEQAWGQHRGSGDAESWPAVGQPDYGQQPGHGQPGYAYGPPAAASAAGFTPTVGLIAAIVGGVLVLLSLFALNFLEFSVPGLSQSFSLGDVAGDFGDDAPVAIGTYADFGRYLALILIAVTILAVLRLVPQLQSIRALPIIVAGVCAAFALWHLLAMLSSAEDGVDVSPTFGAILGLLGYAGLAAGPFLEQPVGGRR